MPGWSLRAVRRVPAGSSALARDLIVTSAAGGSQRLILRCFPHAWQGSPRSKVERERLALGVLEGSGLPIPRCVRADEDGAALGWPAVIQTRLPGRVWWPRAASPACAA